jgi:hypothetical protein
MYRDREFLGDKFIANSIYYNEFHHPNDLNYLTSVKLVPSTVIPLIYR